MQATLAQAVGDYWERPVQGPLRQYFTCMWLHDLPAGSPPIIVVPDGCIDLQLIDGALRIAGPDGAAQTEDHAAGTRILGLRFQPASAAAWLGVPASEIVNQRIRLEDIWGAEGRHLSARLSEMRDPVQLLRSLETVTSQARFIRSYANRDMRAAYDLLSAGAPPENQVIPWLAGELALSERTLRRRFEVFFGYSPKTLDRILRFQRFLGLLRRDGRNTSLAGLAAEAGYADQAHLARESSRLSGTVPSSVLDLLTS